MRFVNFILDPCGAFLYWGRRGKDEGGGGGGGRGGAEGRILHIANSQ